MYDGLEPKPKTHNHGLCPGSAIYKAKTVGFKIGMDVLLRRYADDQGSRPLSAIKPELGRRQRTIRYH